MTPIKSKYLELKTRGFFPLVELPVVEIPLPDFQGRFFSFMTAGGPVNIYYHPDTGAYEVHGAILATYLAQGGPTGVLGYPVSDEYDDIVNGAVVGRVNDFHNGAIFWSSSTGQVTIMTVGPVTTLGFEAIDGIDVSEFQRGIDWQRVVTEGGQSFAYVRATDGDTYKDQRFAENWANSRGILPRGAYHFFRARRVVDQTRMQADNFLDTLLQARDIGELPVVVDVEEESFSSGVTAAEAERSLQFFLSYVEQGLGKRPIIYTNPNTWLHLMNNSQAFSQGYKLWISNFGAKRADGGYEMRRTGPLLPGGWSEFTLWQYAVRPGVAGISTFVDRDSVMLPVGESLIAFLS